MSMQSGSGNTGLTNEPNVTPMIDVLMVLLIIFMVIVPSSRKALDVQLPDPNPQPSSAPNTQQSCSCPMPGCPLCCLGNRPVRRREHSGNT